MATGDQDMGWLERGCPRWFEDGVISFPVCLMVMMMSPCSGELRACIVCCAALGCAVIVWVCVVVVKLELGVIVFIFLCAPEKSEQ